MRVVVANPSYPRPNSTTTRRGKYSRASSTAIATTRISDAFFYTVATVATSPTSAVTSREHPCILRLREIVLPAASVPLPSCAVTCPGGGLLPLLTIPTRATTYHSHYYEAAVFLHSSHVSKGSGFYINHVNRFNAFQYLNNNLRKHTKTPKKF